jgi:hypothetical protein
MQHEIREITSESTAIESQRPDEKTTKEHRILQLANELAGRIQTGTNIQGNLKIDLSPSSSKVTLGQHRPRKHKAWCFILRRAI